MILHGLLRDDHPNFKRIFRMYFFEERETFTSLLDSIGNNTTIEGNAIFLIIISRFYSRMITILPRFGFAIYGLETIFYIYISIEIELAERWKSLAGLLSGLEITKNIRGRLITALIISETFYYDVHAIHQRECIVEASNTLVSRPISSLDH